MKTVALGLPPPGEAAALPERAERIPSPLREAIAEKFEDSYPGVYILAAHDIPTDVVALYHRTRETWMRGSEVKEILLLSLARPGRYGALEVAWMKCGEEYPLIDPDTRDTYPSGTLLSSTYSEPMHSWMREKAQALASLIGCAFREI